MSKQTTRRLTSWFYFFVFLVLTMSLAACGPDDPEVTGGEDAGGDATDTGGDECTSGEELCDGQCVDTSESVDHCGACNMPCEVGDNATAVCNSGTCELECSPGYSDDNGDLEDGCEAGACQESNGGVEICDNMDNDCDGIVDNGFDTGEICNVGVGACANEGQMECSEDGSDTVCSEEPGEPSSEVCGNAIDEDCDGESDEDDASDATTWYADTDGDGYGDPNSTKTSCTKPAGYVDNSEDCADDKSTANPDGTESCDGVDNDCDGDTDEDYSNKGTACSVGTGVCEQSGSYECTTDGQSTTCDASPGTPPEADEQTCDGLDNDCDGSVDEGCDMDNDGWCNPNMVVESGASCSASPAKDCDDSDDTINPGADELCDSVDHDCDGDERAGAVDAPTWYLDCDGDTFASNTTNTVVQCYEPPTSDAEAQCPDPGLFGSNEWTDKDPTVSGQRDCEDEEPFAYPGQTEYFPESYTTTNSIGSPIESYDWNCDNSLERKWTATDGNCGCFCTSLSCPPSEAWTGSSIPNCGDAAELKTCTQGSNLSCNTSTQVTEQRCR